MKIGVADSAGKTHGLELAEGAAAVREQELTDARGITHSFDAAGAYCGGKNDGVSTDDEGEPPADGA